MNVLSLFDGISCARVALLRAGLPVKTYFASEIDPHAIRVSTHHFPDTIHLGDVRTLTQPPSDSIDLLIGGSPCVDLSIAKQNRKGLEGDHSSLFWEYVRVKDLVRPKVFILENVASMPKKDRDIITATLGVDPVMLDASLVSAQSRRRLFWTNLPLSSPPKDRGIVLKDILQPDAEIDARMMTASQKAFCLTSTYAKTGTSEAEYERNATARKRTLIKVGGLYWTPAQYPIHIPEGASTASIRVGHEMRRKLKDGKRADDDPTIPPIRRIETRNDDKCGTLTTILKDNPVVDLDRRRIRKLTPIECERLMGLPDDYTASIPLTHRYRCLGNAFNVDIIVHLLKDWWG